MQHHKTLPSPSSHQGKEEEDHHVRQFILKCVREATDSTNISHPEQHGASTWQASLKKLLDSAGTELNANNMRSSYIKHYRYSYVILSKLPEWGFADLAGELASKGKKAREIADQIATKLESEQRSLFRARVGERNRSSEANPTNFDGVERIIESSRTILSESQTIPLPEGAHVPPRGFPSQLPGRKSTGSEASTNPLPISADQEEATPVRRKTSLKYVPNFLRGGSGSGTNQGTTNAPGKTNTSSSKTSSKQTTSTLGAFNIIRKPTDRIFGGSSSNRNFPGAALPSQSSNVTRVNRLSDPGSKFVRNVSEIVFPRLQANSIITAGKSRHQQSMRNVRLNSRLEKVDSPRVARRVSRRVDFADPFMGFAAERDCLTLHQTPKTPVRPRRPPDSALYDGSGVEEECAARQADTHVVDITEYRVKNPKRMGKVLEQPPPGVIQSAVTATREATEDDTGGYPKLPRALRMQAEDYNGHGFVSNLTSFREPPPVVPPRPLSLERQLDPAEGSGVATGSLINPPMSAVAVDSAGVQRPSSSGQEPLLRPVPRVPPMLASGSLRGPGFAAVPSSPPSRASNLLPGSETSARRYFTMEGASCDRNSTLLLLENRFHPSESAMSSSLGTTDISSGLCGLKNLGNTCYLNSIVQCLSGTNPLVRFFTTGHFRKFIRHNPGLNALSSSGTVAGAFAQLLKDMRSGMSTFVVPMGLLEEVGRENEMFRGGEQQDSQEFLSFMLNALHEDLNNPLSAESDLVESLSDDDDDGGKHWARYQLKNQSVIVDLFQIQLRSTLMCQRCNYKSRTHTPEWFLTLPIPTVLRRQPSMDLKDCLDAFLESEVLSGDNQWSCPRCQRKVDAQKRLGLARLPAVLLVNIKRFEYNGIFRNKISSLVSFPHRALNLNPYVGAPPDGPNIYDLYAISNHYGGLDGGHYTAIVYNGFVDRWHLFDDTRVSVVKEESVVTSAAYNLFYVRRK